MALSNERRNGPIAGELVDRKFTPDAQEVMRATFKIATVDFNNGYIMTEHLLLGIIRVGQSHSSQFLLRKGLSPDNIKRHIEFLTIKGQRPVSSETIATSPRLEKIMMLASTEAKGGKINDTHMLIGIIREGEGVAAGVLRRLGVGENDLHLLRRQAERESVLSS